MQLANFPSTNEHGARKWHVHSHQSDDAHALSSTVRGGHIELPPESRESAGVDFYTYIDAVSVSATLYC